MVYKRKVCLGCSVYSLAIFVRNNTYKLVWTCSQSRCITFIYLLALKWGIFLIFPEECWEQVIFTTVQPYGPLALCCLQFALLSYYSILLCSFTSSLPQQQINSFSFPTSFPGNQMLWFSAQKCRKQFGLWKVCRRWTTLWPQKSSLWKRRNKTILLLITWIRTFCSWEAGRSMQDTQTHSGHWPLMVVQGWGE